MKTILKLTLVLFAFLQIQSCTTEDIQTASSNNKFEEVVSWKPGDGIRKFIPQEYLQSFKQDEFKAIENLMQNPYDEGLISRSAPIHIAAGTTDKLNAAIAASENGDVIILDPGDHFETGTVWITKSLTITGYGANLIFSNTPAFTSSTVLPWTFKAAMYINKSGCISTIRGIHFKGADAIPGLCIFVENSKDVRILSNTFENWQESIVMYNSEYCTIWRNKISANPGWTTGVIPESDGIVLSDGSHNQIIENEVENAVLGIFTGGTLGIDFSNNTHNCLYGQILCKVPSGLYVVNGFTVNTNASTSNWIAMFNNSTDNYAAGYLLIDGTNKDYLDHNKASNNAAYDIELTGDSYRFGFFTPKSFNNRVSAYGWLKVKDCGDNNKVYGGSLVNNTLDPCN
ncbi:MAG: right-handed parallel beta-helix repeat-containing protein [Saprospiraceae bacterium]